MDTFADPLGDQGVYRTRANKGRGFYSKIIFWPNSAANNQERLQFENYFLDLQLRIILIASILMKFKLFKN